MSGGRKTRSWETRSRARSRLVGGAVFAATRPTLGGGGERVVRAAEQVEFGRVLEAGEKTGDKTPARGQPGDEQGAAKEPGAGGPVAQGGAQDFGLDRAERIRILDTPGPIGDFGEAAGGAPPGVRAAGEIEHGGAVARGKPQVGMARKLAPEIHVGELSGRRRGPAFVETVVGVEGMSAPREGHPEAAASKGGAVGGIREIVGEFQAIAVFEDAEREGARHVRAGEQALHLRDVAGEVEVAVAEVADDAAAGLLQGFVPVGLAAAGVLGVVEEEDARILASEGESGVAGDVVDAVADDEDLEVGNALAQHAFDGEAEHGAAVDGGGDDDGGGQPRAKRGRRRGGGRGRREAHDKAAM